MQGAKFIFISIQLNHKTNVKCGNLLFIFFFIAHQANLELK